MAALYYMVGLQGAGKSTYSEALSEMGVAVHISSDKIREELYGNVDHQGNNSEIFNEMFKRTKDNLLKGNNVVYDATNISSKKRKAFLSQLPKDIKKICMYSAFPIDVCIERDSQRDRTVGADVINRYYKNAQIPMYHEGWDLIRIRYSPSVTQPGVHESVLKPKSYEKFLDGLYQSPLISNCAELEQHSSYHTLTVSEHMYKAYEYVKDKKVPIVLKLAAILHDCGKPVCKEFKGEYASYIGHENVSAQLAVLCLKRLGYSDSTAIKVGTYIQLHMRMHQLDTEKSKRKLIDLVGEDVYKNLEILHEADNQAK